MKILVAILGVSAFLILLMLILTMNISGITLLGLIIWFLFCVLWFAIVSVSFDLNELVRLQKKNDNV